MIQDAAICVFPWDFADEGIEPVLEYVADAGLTSLYLASVYHAGWFVLPHNPRPCYMPEDGVAYFHPNQSCFESTEIKPQVAEMAAKTDWFAEVAGRLSTFGLRLTAWTVCNHNTRIGQLFPEHTVRNALGDTYPHALTPASPAVRAYICGLASCLASQYPLQSIFLESPGYQGRRHAHHHERSLTPFGPLENELMDISFSRFDTLAAERAGIDAEQVRRAVELHIRSFLKNVPSRPHGMPTTIEQFHDLCPSLPSYQLMLDENVRQLIAEVKKEVKRFGIELEGEDRFGEYDWLVVEAHNESASAVAEITRATRCSAHSHQRVRVGFQLGIDLLDTQGAILSEEDCRQCVAAAAKNGADGLYFYNYAESPRGFLDWIKPALKAADVAHGLG